MAKLLRKLHPARLARKLDSVVRAGRAALGPRAAVERETVAVAVAVRQRGGARVANFLRTLRAQSLPERCVDITVCDFGSDAAAVAELTALCREHRARLVLAGEQAGEWNKSWALNIALRHGAEHARWVLPTDIDMLFGPNFIETLIRAHLAHEPALVLAQFKDLPPETPLAGVDVVADFDRLAREAEWVGEHAVGPCLSTSRAWCFRVRGFDERMNLWGYMDQDYAERARRDGLREVWIHDRALMLHQWHPRKFEVHRDDPAQQALMQARYEGNRQLFETDETIARNAAGWGERPVGGVVVG
jgi:hypothetical protein